MKTVRDLLKSKGASVYSVSPSTSVYDALVLMADRNIGALLVLDEAGALAGIFSERDYARKIALKGLGSRTTAVSAIMTADVVCIPSDTSVEACMGLMTERHFRHLPVVENDRPVGMVSIGDIGRALIEEQGFVISQLERYIYHGR